MFSTFFKKLEDKERAWRMSFGNDISTPEARKKTLTHFRWVDHAILRVLWHNFHQLSAEAYRSNQPSPERFESYKAKGIRTIINLRGISPHSNYLFEEEACGNLGLNLVNFHLSANNLPSRDVLLELENAFETVEKPFLLHCKSGSDRAGFASVLYLMLMRDQPVDIAQKQLHWRYLHLKMSSTGILDFFFDEYRRDNNRQPISLQDWISTRYNPEEMTERYRKMRSSGRNG